MCLPYINGNKIMDKFDEKIIDIRAQFIFNNPEIFSQKGKPIKIKIEEFLEGVGEWLKINLFTI